MHVCLCVCVCVYILSIDPMKRQHVSGDITSTHHTGIEDHPIKTLKYPSSKFTSFLPEPAVQRPCDVINNIDDRCRQEAKKNGGRQTIQTTTHPPHQATTNSNVMAVEI
mmetsp:Transcript_28843/g.50764  ORF Transcript_28843/g.50764 Transcript_28843/m.50764 type:complete len:109 (+) Transcript_28843:76-402(+)